MKKSLSLRGMGIVILTALISIFVVMPAQAQKVEKPKNIAKENIVIITGKLVKKDKSPVTDGRLTVYVYREGKIIVEYKKGRLVNPTSKVDNEGRFTFEIDLDFFKEAFEGAEEFVIGATLDSFSKRTLLRNHNGVIITFKFLGPQNIDLGEIVVE